MLRGDGRGDRQLHAEWRRGDCPHHNWHDPSHACLRWGWPHTHTRNTGAAPGGKRVEGTTAPAPQAKQAEATAPRVYLYSQLIMARSCCALLRCGACSCIVREGKVLCAQEF
jgi:hypothetical protein